MEQPVVFQLWQMGAAAIVGAALALLYDLLRLLRRFRPRLTLPLDVLFVLTVIPTLLLLALYVGHGQFPPFFYPLLALGAWAYFITLGRPLRRIFTALGHGLMGFFRLLARPLGLLSKKSEKLKKYLFSSGRKWVRIKRKRKHSAPTGCTKNGGTQDEDEKDTADR